jgi:hypothetical protein
MNTYSPVISTQADLELAWRHLMGPFGYDHRSVWWMLIQPDDRPIPHLAEVEDASEVPDEVERDNFASLLIHLQEGLDPGTRIAFLVSRPGHDGPRAKDLAWASALYDVASRASLPCEVVHLASDGGVTPLPLDALAA